MILCSRDVCLRVSVATAVLVLGGCAHTDNLLQRASFELDCPAERIEVIEKDGHTASGCGRQAHYTCRSKDWMQSQCRAVAPPEAGDGPSGRNQTEAARASAVKDLDCPEGQLTVLYLEEDIRGVKGCGRRIVYSCSDFLFRYSCEPESAVLPY